MRTWFVLSLLCGFTAPAPVVRGQVLVAKAEQFVVGEGDTLAEARDDAHTRLPQGAHVVRFEQRERNHRWYYKIYYTL